VALSSPRIGSVIGPIRPAQPQDFEAIEAIENEADRLFVERFGSVPWEAAPGGGSRVSAPGFVLVATGGSGALVGFVHVLEQDGFAHLEQLSVLPGHGRRGYGRALLEAAKTEARHRGHDQMTLRTYADVSWNAPFYARAGFTEDEPATEFHEGLVDVEHQLGLDRHGRRVQMVARL